MSYCGDCWQERSSLLTFEVPNQEYSNKKLCAKCYQKAYRIAMLERVQNEEPNATRMG
jgi:hypothetical protein